MNGRMIRTTALMGLFTVVEKALAAGRQVLLAAFFGAGATMDAVVVGISIAELFAAVATGPFLTVFIPLYAVWRSKDGSAAADARAVNLMAVVTVGLTGLAVVLATWGGALAGWVGYGFTAAQRAGARELMPWLAVFFWGTGVGVLLTGLYHVRGRFTLPQIAQSTASLIGLLALVVLAPDFGTRAIAISLGIGALGLVAVLAAVAARRKGVPVPALAPRAPEVGAYVVLFLPLLGSALLDQAIHFTDRAMASTLPAGGVSALYYASILWRLPVALLVANFATVWFPDLSRQMAENHPAELARSLSRSIRSMLLVMLGVTALTLVLAPELTAVFFERGQFSGEATRLTAGVLRALALCFVFQGLGTLVNITLFAAHRTAAVAAAGVAQVALNVALNALLMGPYGAVGIALSTSITLTLWFGFILIPFLRELRRRQVSGLFGGAFARLLLKGAAAAALAAGVAWVAVDVLPLADSYLALRVLRLAAGGLVGLGVYAGALHLMAVPEIGAALRALFGSKRR